MKLKRSSIASGFSRLGVGVMAIGMVWGSVQHLKPVTPPAVARRYALEGHIRAENDSLDILLNALFSMHL